jgi:hypothetical protein
MRTLFFDIDGTIWDRHNMIPESTVRAIRKASKNGHKTFICSGRSRGYITDPRLLDIGFDGIVSACGTMIEFEGREIFCRSIPVDLTEYTINTVRRFGFRPILEGKEYLYMDEREFGNDPYGRKLFAELKDRRKSIDDMWGKWDINKLSCATDDLATEECFDILSPYYDFIVHNSRIVEMVPKGYSKGTGLIHACELLGAAPEDSIAFGDSVNDLDMFRAAGTSVAMGNGSSEARECADIITTDLKDNGIENALIRLGII